MGKTKYTQFTSNTSIPTPITIEENIMIEPCNDGYKYLGIKIIRSNSIYEQIMTNINEKKRNIAKFNHWVDTPTHSPIRCWTS